ncbi:MAG: hypothetical protein ACYTEZ_11680 [Planctomycetota bacterium]|jgi:hypothetical protein
MRCLTLIIVLLAASAAPARERSLERRIRQKANRVARVLKKLEATRGFRQRMRRLLADPPRRSEGIDSREHDPAVIEEAQKQLAGELAAVLKRFHDEQKNLELARGTALEDPAWEAAILGEILSQVSSLEKEARGWEKSADAYASLSPADVAAAYPDGGGYDEKRDARLGVPHDIRAHGMYLKKRPEGTYCSGFTFAVVMDLAEVRGLLEGKTPDEMQRFRRQWYGRKKTGAEKKQAVTAMETLGIGREVTHDDAQPGDFVQFWRDQSFQSGHSAVFLGWILRDGVRVGIHFRSSQGKKKNIGISNWEAYYPGEAPRDKKAGEDYTRVRKTRLYFGRLNRG